MYWVLRSLPEDETRQDVLRSAEIELGGGGGGVVAMAMFVILSSLDSRWWPGIEAKCCHGNITEILGRCVLLHCNSSPPLQA